MNYPGIVQRKRFSIALLLFLFLATLSEASLWPQFRGPTGLGYSTEKNLPVTWGGKDNENVLWKTALVGQGHASPIVWGNKVIVCTVSWPADVTSKEKVIPEHHVTCYQTTDGKMLWDTLVPPGPWVRNDFRSGAGGGYAAPTPVTDGKLIYCAFASSVIAVIDFDGKIQWRKEIIPFSFDVTWGSSPILYQDTVILFCPMAKSSDSCVFALNKDTGEEKWREKFPDMGFAHSTPVIIQVKAKPQMLLVATGGGVKDNGLRSLDPSTGKVLWWCRGGGDAASPAFGDGLVYFDSGRGGLGVAVDPTGAGDVSQSNIRWTVNQVPEGIGSPIIVSNYVYRLHSPGVLKCWDAANGKVQYSERLEGLSTTWASPIVDANGRLYFANGGKSIVLQCGPEFHVLATNDLGDANHPSPAVADGRMFLVGMKNIYCIGSK